MSRQEKSYSMHQGHFQLSLIQDLFFLRKYLNYFLSDRTETENVGKDTQKTIWPTLNSTANNHEGHSFEAHLHVEQKC